MRVPPVAPKKTERLSVAVTPEMSEGCRQASADLGMTMNAWLGMAIGRAVRSHRMEREVLEKVLMETMGAQMRLELDELAKALGEHDDS